MDLLLPGVGPFPVLGPVGLLLLTPPHLVAYVAELGVLAAALLGQPPVADLAFPPVADRFPVVVLAFVAKPSVGPLLGLRERRVAVAL